MRGRSRTRPAPPDADDRAAMAVGAATLGIGAALLAWPARCGRWLALDDPSSARAVGLLDLLLVPGLLLGPRRPMWLIGRVGLNAVIAGHVLRSQRHTGRFSRAATVAALLATASVGDGRVALRHIRRRGPAAR